MNRFTKNGQASNAWDNHSNIMKMGKNRIVTAL